MMSWLQYDHHKYNTLDQQKQGNDMFHPEPADSHIKMELLLQESVRTLVVEECHKHVK